MFLSSHFTWRNSLSTQRRCDSGSSNNIWFILLTWSAAYVPFPQAAYILVLCLLCQIFYKATVDLPATQELNQQPFLIKRKKKKKKKKEKPVWKARYREFFLFILISVFIITLLLLCLDFTGLQNQVRYQDGKLKHFAYTSSRARRRRGETGAETYKLTIHEPAHVQLFCKHI